MWCRLTSCWPRCARSLADLEVDAIKIGMLATGPVIEAVAEGLKDFPACRSCSIR